MASNGHSTHTPWLNRGFGLLSIGLGATEVAAPRRVAKLIGMVPKSRGSLIVRALGLREIATGLSLLMMPRRSVPMWARVAGDAIDLAVLGWIATSKSSNKKRIAIAAATIAGITVLDIIASRRASQLS